jgi:hypothetical protein
MLFYIMQIITVSEFCIFPQICNHLSLFGPDANGGSVNPTSQVCSFAMLVLPIVGKYEVRF